MHHYTGIACPDMKKVRPAGHWQSAYDAFLGDRAWKLGQALRGWRAIFESNWDWFGQSWSRDWILLGVRGEGPGFGVVPGDITARCPCTRFLAAHVM